MAKPQLENGFTSIANELLEKLATISLSPNQWQVLLVIIRKTYGFHKKVDYIANFQIGEATGLCKAVVSRCLKHLSDMQFITRKGKVIGFQKDWAKWKELAIPLTLGSELAEQSTSEVSNTANQSKQFGQPKLAIQSTKVSSPAVTQKIKETIQKKLYKRYGEFDNVLLTDQQYHNLEDRFNRDTIALIEKLSAYMESAGRHYKSHYATILNWQRKDQEGKHGKAQHSRELPKIYTPTPDYPDL